MDMTRFRKLAELELDIDMLCSAPYDPSMRDLEWDESESVGDPAWPKLIDMLPKSIERFNLHIDTFSDDHLKCISHLIDGLSDARVTKLPHLDELRLFVGMDLFLGMDPDMTIPDEALEALNAARRSGFSILKLGTSTPLL